MTQHLGARRLVSRLLIAASALGLVVGVGLPVDQAAAAPQMRTASGSFGYWGALRFFGALQAAGSVIGTPYRWGGSGPGGFDCSGLVQWSMRHSGVNLPRDSRSQRAATMPISAAEVQPGDLVFYGSPVHHVGIAVGDGLMIHSPSSGGSVHIAPIYRNGMNPSSFGRIK